MKQTPEEKRRMINFQSGTLSKEGFLGPDNRHVHDIIQSDIKALGSLGLNCEQAADDLKYYLDLAKGAMDTRIEEGDFILQSQWDRGMLPCPFGEPGLHPKVIVTILHQPSGRTIRYSQLSIHLLRRHCFLGGRKSAFRVEPDDCFLLSQNRPEKIRV